MRGGKAALLAKGARRLSIDSSCIRDIVLYTRRNAAARDTPAAVRRRRPVPIRAGGAVRDRPRYGGASVSDGVITAENQSTTAHFRVVSGDRGEYRLLGLPSGEYALTVQRTGFRSYRQSGITLRAGDQRTLDIAVEVGGPETQAIEVKGDAPLLETATGQVSYSVDRTKMMALPLDGRNFIPLVALSPGVALPGGGSLLPRINGSRPRTNEYLYDGISVLQPEPGQVAFYPIIDAIAEFRLNINSYSPEYGRSNGGTVMVIEKSGSERAARHAVRVLPQ